MAKVGRYKFNKKLALYNRIIGKRAATDIVDEETGELFVSQGEKITRDKAIEIENSGIKVVDVLTDEGKVVRVIGNHFVSSKAFDLPFL